MGSSAQGNFQVNFFRGWCGPCLESVRACGPATLNYARAASFGALLGADPGIYLSWRLAERSFVDYHAELAVAEKQWRAVESDALLWESCSSFILAATCVLYAMRAKSIVTH